MSKRQRRKARRLKQELRDFDVNARIQILDLPSPALVTLSATVTPPAADPPRIDEALGKLDMALSKYGFTPEDVKDAPKAVREMVERQGKETKH